jgi:hypothetical protein
MNPRAHMVWLLALTLTSVAPPTAAHEENGQSGEEAEREADLFGGPTPVPPEKAPADPTKVISPASSAGDRGLDDPTLSDGLIRGMLQKADDPLTVGGQLSLRFQYLYADEHGPDSGYLASPSQVSLFLDARPNDRVRAYVRGRLKYDFTLERGQDVSGLPADALAATLDQLWLKADLGRVLFLSIGRQPIRWGASRFWNPTDFLNQQRRDPLAFFDERVGPTLLKLHLPLESLGWNFYAVANLEGASTPEEVGGALRGEFLLGPVELNASAAYRKDQPLRLGLDLSTGLWLLDLRLEAAVLHDEHAPFWRGRFDPAAGVLPSAYVRDTRWIPQATAGAELTLKYSDEDSLLLGIEYFFNDAGYPDAGLYGWLLVQSFQGLGGYTPFYLGRHYVAAYAVLLNPGSWNNTTFTLSGLCNLCDQTGLVRLDYQVRVLTYLDVAVFGAAHLGKDGEFHLGLEVPPLVGVPGVPEAYQGGFEIPASRFELGVWLTLAL